MNDRRFNNLTHSEDELLSWLAEELAETIVAVEKIRRHGWFSFNPDLPEEKRTTNREDLEKELGHVGFITDVLIAKGHLDSRNLVESHLKKRNQIQRSLLTKAPLLHHNEV